MYTIYVVMASFMTVESEYEIPVVAFKEMCKATQYIEEHEGKRYKEGYVIGYPTYHIRPLELME